MKSYIGKHILKATNLGSCEGVLWCQNWDTIWIQLLWKGVSGASNCYLKLVFSTQKIIVKYVSWVPALTLTISLFVKTGIHKLNEVFNLRINFLILLD